MTQEGKSCWLAVHHIRWPRRCLSDCVECEVCSLYPSFLFYLSLCVFFSFSFFKNFLKDASFPVTSLVRLSIYLSSLRDSHTRVWSSFFSLFSSLARHSQLWVSYFICIDFPVCTYIGFSLSFPRVLLRFPLSSLRIFQRDHEMREIFPFFLVMREIFPIFFWHCRTSPFNKITGNSIVFLFFSSLFEIRSTSWRTQKLHR